MSAGKAARVERWNAFLHLARDATRAVDTESLATTPRDSKRSGARLSEQQEAILAALSFCTLAVEARINHLVHEEHEEGRLSRRERDAMLRLPLEHRWFLLPRITGRRRQLSSDGEPHEAIAQICAARNDLVHVRFAELRQRLPNVGEMVGLYNDFIRAMEDMNVVLGRTPKPRHAVLALMIRR
jgi:hypothetical protein